MTNKKTRRNIRSSIHLHTQSTQLKTRKNNPNTQRKSNNSSKLLDQIYNQMVDSYKETMQDKKLPKLPKRELAHFSDGFIRRMNDPLFL
jgi:hypothetical protein